MNKPPVLRQPLRARSKAWRERRSKKTLPQTATVALLLAGLACSVPTPSEQENSGFGMEQSGFGLEQFVALMEQLALGWNTNDAHLAASVFSKDAIYVEPPDKQIYRGRDQIFEFFGGSEGRDSWMRMEWHNLSYNKKRQVGAGEFTFSWEGGQVHGMVSLKIEGELISRWREYFYHSDLNWQEFRRASRF